MNQTLFVLSTLISGLSYFLWIPAAQAQQSSESSCQNEPTGILFDETLQQWQEINRLTCEGKWEEATALMHRMTLAKKDDLACPLCEITLPFGETLRQKWQWQKAFEFYNFALSNPVILDGSEYEVIGHHLVVHGQYYEALDAFRPLGQYYLGHEDGTAYSYTRLGDSLKVLMRWEEARLAYEKALEVDSQQPFAYVGMGLVLMEYEQWEEAIATFEKALEFHPTLTTPIKYIEEARDKLGSN